MFEPTDSAPTSPTEPGVANRRRRWVAPVAVLAALGVGVGGTLAATRPWADDPVTDPAAAPADDPEDAEAGAAGSETGAEAEPGRPELPARRFVVDPAPEGFELTWLNDPAELSDEELGFGPGGGTAVLLVADGATLSTGPWVGINARPLDRFERPGWDPRSSMPVETSRAVQVGDYAGAVGESWDGSTMLTFGPVDDLFAVTLNAQGIDEPALLTLGAGIRIEADRPRIDAAALPVEMEVLATAEGVWDAQPLSMFTQWNAVVNSTYTDGGIAGMQTGTGASFTLQHQLAAGGDDPLRVPRFLFDDAVEVDVAGASGVQGTLGAMGFGTSVLTWIDGDDALTLTSGGVAGDEQLDLVAIAAAVREADEDEWADLVDEVKERQREMEEVFQNPIDTWLIAAGDLDDSSTWVAEGAFTEEGAFVPSVSEMSGDGGMSGGGAFAGNAAAVEIPGVLVQPPSMNATVVYALATLDAAGAVLRLTLDDGRVVESPLRAVRPEWPALVAAVGIPSGDTGQAELVAGDGAVLASSGLDGFPGFGGGVPATTAAAAEG